MGRLHSKGDGMERRRAQRNPRSPVRRRGIRVQVCRIEWGRGGSGVCARSPV